MDNDNIDDKIILNALGALENSEKEEFEKFLLSSNLKTKELTGEFNNLMVLLNKTLPSENIGTLNEIKEKILNKINESENDSTKNDFRFVFSENNKWFTHPVVNNIKIKQLSFNEKNGYAVLILDVPPGTEYPDHHHNGAEECYIIEGDLYSEGKYLKKGDFLHADSNSEHKKLYTKNGCKLLLIVSSEDM